MHIIDPEWTDLSLGYQAAQTLQSRLESEFGRAVDVGHKQKYRRELTGWQKKRRVFFALVALAPLSVIALCLTAYYFREVACILAWWLVTVLLIFVTLAVAGWSFIREMVSGRPVPQRARVAASMADRWWDSLSPHSLLLGSSDRRGEADFLSLLGNVLPDTWLAVSGLLTTTPTASDTDLLLLGPSGLWIFEVRHWSGAISKQDGIWKLVHKKKEELLHGQAPDEQWEGHRDEILNTIQTRLPHLSWTSDLLRGGVVFSHPKAELDQSSIRGNTAAYGAANAWVERLRQSQTDERFSLEVQLEILDTLITLASRNEQQAGEYASSKGEAERIYEQVAGQLREYVAKLVK